MDPLLTLDTKTCQLYQQGTPEMKPSALCPRQNTSLVFMLPDNCAVCPKRKSCPLTTFEIILSDSPLRLWPVRLQHTSPIRYLSTLRLRSQVPKINMASSEQLPRATLPYSCPIKTLATTGLPEYVATHSYPTDYLAPLRTRHLPLLTRWGGEHDPIESLRPSPFVSSNGQVENQLSKGVFLQAENKHGRDWRNFARIWHLSPHFCIASCAWKWHIQNSLLHCETVHPSWLRLMGSVTHRRSPRVRRGDTVRWSDGEWQREGGPELGSKQVQLLSEAAVWTLFQMSVRFAARRRKLGSLWSPQLCLQGVFHTTRDGILALCWVCVAWKTTVKTSNLLVAMLHLGICRIHHLLPATFVVGYFSRCSCA